MALSDKVHEDHPALYLHLQDRLAYARLVGAIVGADEVVTPEELRALRDLCRCIGLPPDHSEHIVRAASTPQTLDLQQPLQALRDSDLRFALVRDMAMIGWSDGKYDVLERRRVRSLATMMTVSEEEVCALEDEVSARLGLTAHDDLDALVPDEPTGDLVGLVGPALAGLALPLGLLLLLAPKDRPIGEALAMGLGALGGNAGVPGGGAVALTLAVCTALLLGSMYRWMTQPSTR